MPEEIHLNNGYVIKTRLAGTPQEYYTAKSPHSEEVFTSKDLAYIKKKAGSRPHPSRIFNASKWTSTNQETPSSGTSISDQYLAKRREQMRSPKLSDKIDSKISDTLESDVLESVSRMLNSATKNIFENDDKNNNEDNEDNLENNEENLENHEENIDDSKFTSNIDMKTVDRSPMARTMQQQGHTVTSLADAVGVLPPAISRILRTPKRRQGDPGGRNPSIGLAAKIANELKMDSEALFPDIFGIPKSELKAKKVPGNRGSGMSQSASGSTRKGSEYTKGNK